MMENINTSNSLEDPLEHLLEEIQEHLNKIDNIKPENNKTENPRLQKGITLQQQGHVKQNKDPNTWTVKGQNTKTYNVKYIPEHGWICNCPDHTYRNETCKHIHATKIQTSQNINLKKEEEEDTKPSPSPSLIGVKISKNNNSNSFYSLDFSNLAKVRSISSTSFNTFSRPYKSLFSRITRRIPSLTIDFIDFPDFSFKVVNNLYRSAGTSTVTLTILDSFISSLSLFYNYNIIINFITLSHRHFSTQLTIYHFTYLYLTLKRFIYINIHKFNQERVKEVILIIKKFEDVI